MVPKNRLFFYALFLRFIAKFIRKNRKFPGNFCKDGIFLNIA